MTKYLPGTVKQLERQGPDALPLAVRKAAWQMEYNILLDLHDTSTRLLADVLAMLGAGGPDGLVVPGGRVVAKHFWRDAPAPRVGLLASERERRFGETALTFYRRIAGEDDEEG